MFCSVRCLLVLLIDPACHCDHLDGKKGASYSAFLWFVDCALPVIVCLLFPVSVFDGYHYENTPIHIYRKFHLLKLKNFRQKTLMFFIFLLKI